MGRFGKMLGKFEFNIKGEDISLTPKMGDNAKLMKVMAIKDEEDRLSRLLSLFSEWMIREYPEEPADEIRMFVEFNFAEFLREILVGFKYTTREEWDKNTGDAQKKLMSGN